MSCVHQLKSAPFLYSYGSVAAKAREVLTLPRSDRSPTGRNSSYSRSNCVLTPLRNPRSF